MRISAYILILITAIGWPQLGSCQNSKIIQAGSDADHDWYDIDTDQAPENITDTIYTTGFVGINTNGPTADLHTVGEGIIQRVNGTVRYGIRTDIASANAWSVFNPILRSGLAFFHEETADSTYNQFSIVSNGKGGFDTQMSSIDFDGGNQLNKGTYATAGVDGFNIQHRRQDTILYNYQMGPDNWKIVKVVGSTETGWDIGVGNLDLIEGRGDLQLESYPNTRNDAAAALNFLYTDADGNLLSKDINTIGSGSSGGCSCTKASGHIYFNTNDLDTVDITGVSYYNVDSMLLGEVDSFSYNGSGRLTYTGSRDIKVKVDWEKIVINRNVTGFNHEIYQGVTFNGAEVPQATRVWTNLLNQDTQPRGGSYIQSISTGDYFEVGVVVLSATTTRYFGRIAWATLTIAEI